MRSSFLSALPLSMLPILSLVALPATSWADWLFVPPPTQTSGSDMFTAIDGISFDDVWAVGVWQPAGYTSLAMHFDGASWTRLPTPANDGRLTGISATSPDHAIAVGTHTPVGSTAQPLAMEWNGSQWELIPVPEQPGGRSFRSVDHLPSGETWVAGHQLGVAFLAQRNGQEWDLNFAPPVGTFRNRFYAMHARGNTEIWVAGTQSDGFGEFEILLQRYDGGSSWTTFDVASPGIGIGDALTGVVAFSADDAWAVGYYYHIPLYLYQPLIMHYDGASWTTIDLPEYPEGSARLESVAATAPDDIVAAGTYATAQGLPRPFVLEYDGETWTEVALPPTGGSGEWFRGVGVTPGGEMWAVGQYYDGVSTEPMAFRRRMITTALAGDAPANGPRRPVVSAAVPNPFRSSTDVRFTVQRRGPISLRLWDVSGRFVRTLLDGRYLAPGEHVVHWDGRDASGRAVAAGVYFYELDDGNRRQRQMMLRVR